MVCLTPKTFDTSIENNNVQNDFVDAVKGKLLNLGDYIYSRLKMYYALCTLYCTVLKRDKCTLRPLF